jgi:hypothetical protein
VSAATGSRRIKEHNPQTGRETRRFEIVRDEKGKPVIGRWEPVITVEQRRAVTDVIGRNADPTRYTGGGCNSRKYLLVGTLRCRCGEKLRATKSWGSGGLGPPGDIAGDGEAGRRPARKASLPGTSSEPGPRAAAGGHESWGSGGLGPPRDIAGDSEVAAGNEGGVAAGDQRRAGPAGSGRRPRIVGARGLGPPGDIAGDGEAGRRQRGKRRCRGPAAGRARGQRPAATNRGGPGGSAPRETSRATAKLPQATSRQGRLGTATGLPGVHIPHTSEQVKPVTTSPNAGWDAAWVPGCRARSEWPGGSAGASTAFRGPFSSCTT